MGEGPPPLQIGVLALQGGFEAHARVLRSLGAEPTEVRAPSDLAGLDGLVIPGGESSTITMGLESSGLDTAIPAFTDGGGAVLGTCAGLIVAGSENLGLIDVTTERNAYGRQLQSFEADIDLPSAGDEPLRAVFIRAPRVSGSGAGVEVLARWKDDPVVVREGAVLGTVFHPELTDDPRLHALFMAIATTARDGSGVAGRHD